MGLQHIGVAVNDVEVAAERFETLFGVKADDLRTDQHHGTQSDMMIEPGNPYLWLDQSSARPRNRVTEYIPDTARDWSTLP